MEGPQITGALRQQEELFRAKFGREMGAQDPVFSDPDADEPVPVDQGKMMGEVRQQAERCPILRCGRTCWRSPAAVTW